MDITERLAGNIRKRRGLTFWRDFARKLKISQTTLARIENAGQNITLQTLKQLMKALKCDISDLFN